MASALQAAYAARLERGEIRPDPAQRVGLEALARLEVDLCLLYTSPSPRDS